MIASGVYGLKKRIATEGKEIEENGERKKR